MAGGQPPAFFSLSNQTSEKWKIRNVIPTGRSGDPPPVIPTGRNGDPPTVIPTEDPEGPSGGIWVDGAVSALLPGPPDSSTPAPLCVASARNDHWAVEYRRPLLPNSGLGDGDGHGLKISGSEINRTTLTQSSRNPHRTIKRRMRGGSILEIEG